jgi:hypothetical protein
MKYKFYLRDTTSPRKLEKKNQDNCRNMKKKLELNFSALEGQMAGGI